MADARTGKRFSLRLPIRIQQANSRRAHRGVTHDLSAAGVYISANLPFRLGTKVNFEITLPAGMTGTPKDVALHGNGRVVRIDARDHHHGVACVIDRYRFVSDKKKTAGSRKKC